MSKKIKIIIALLTLTLLLLPACNNKTTTPLPEMVNYSDDFYGFSIDYPDDWTVSQTMLSQFQASKTSAGESPTEVGIVINLDKTEYTSGLTLEKYYQGYLTNFQQNSTVTDLEELSAGPDTFGQNITGYTATWKMTDDSGTWRLNWYLANTRGIFYSTFFYSSDSDYKDNEVVFDAVINTFKFIDITPIPAKKTYTSAPPMTIDENKQYTVTMTTSYGDMVLELFPADAPQTVNSFVFLIRAGFFDDTIFHRIVPTFVVQGGDPTGTGTSGPGYQIPNEISSRKHIAGSLAMANAGANTNGSQFYICYNAQTTLDGNYTVFGQLIQGTEVLNMIKLGDRLIKVTVEEK